VADGVAQRRWTADELAVALDRSLSCAQAGERLGHTRVQVEKAQKRYRGRDIEQLLAQKRSRAVELERVAQADIARYGEWTPGDPGYRPKLDRNGDGVACEG
jgi:Excalibur calcium-binding domain